MTPWLLFPTKESTGMRKKWIVVVLALLLAGTVYSTWAQDAKPAEDYQASARETVVGKASDYVRGAPMKVTVQGAPGGPMPPGVIVYDTGTFTAIPTLPAGPAVNYCIGNRFNTGGGNPLILPFTVDSLAFWPALVDGGTAAVGNLFISIFGLGNTGAGTADWIDDQLKTGVQAQTWNTRSFTGGVGVFTGTGAASVQAGVWNAGNAGASPMACAADCVGIDSSGTFGGQGFHGMMVEDINGNNYQLFNSFNALVRAIGTNVPVELLDFKVQ
jgi:hypothetical protein